MENFLPICPCVHCVIRTQVATYIISRSWEGMNAFFLVMGNKTADLHASANKFMPMDIFSWFYEHASDLVCYFCKKKTCKIVSTWAKRVPIDQQSKNDYQINVTYLQENWGKKQGKRKTFEEVKWDKKEDEKIRETSKSINTSRVFGHWCDLMDRILLQRVPLGHIEFAFPYHKM